MTDSAAMVTEQLAEAIRAADGRAQDVDAQARDALADTAAVLGEGGALLLNVGECGISFSSA